MATRKLSDRELEEQFDLLCEHMEELRDNHNPLLKLCSFGECNEGLDVFTVYLDSSFRSHRLGTNCNDHVPRSKHFTSHIRT